MNLHRNNDVLSFQIQRRGGWDGASLKKMISYLEEYRLSKRIPRSEVTFLDIGANVGWFTLAIATYGFRVLAFEPMPDNEFLLRSSICMNNLSSLVTVINIGLSNVTSICEIVSGSGNRGNGILNCHNHTLRKQLPNDAISRGIIQVERLDDILPSNTPSILHIPLFKIDVEGQEGFAIEGGHQLFSDPVLTRGIIEMNTDNLIDFRWKIIVELHRANFKSINRQSFNGPPYDLNHAVTTIDVYVSK